MDPDEMEEFLAGLSPEEQEQFLSEYGFGQANMVPGSFGGGAPGAFSPSLSRGSYDLSMMNQLPPDIEYGDVQPFGLDELSSAYNIMQDYGALTLDPAVAAYAGRGAFAPGSFEPSTIPIGEPLDLAGTRYVSMMAGSGPGYESYLAKKIGMEKMTPGQAVASMWQAISTPDEALDPEGLAQKQALIGSLPPLASTDPATGMPSFTQNAGDFSTPEGRAASADVGAITATATDLFERMATDPVPGYTDPATGLPYAGAYQQPSELAEKFDEYGLPYPTASYLDPEYLPQPDPQIGQARTAALTGAQERLDQATNVRDFTQSNFDALTQAWQQSEDERAAAALGPQATGPAENPYNLDPSQLGAAQTAATSSWEDLAAANPYQFGGVQTNQDTSLRHPGAPQFADFRAEARTGAGLPEVLDVGPDTPPQQRELLAQTAEQAKTAYDQAYAEWEEDQRNRLSTEAMRGTAAENMGTANPYVVSSGGKVLDTYNFGGTPEEQAGMGQLMGVVAQLQGNPDVSVGAMPSDWESSWSQGVEDADAQWGKAYLDYERLRNYTDPSQYAGASAVGSALAMEQAGRTPLDDLLMQRAMQRTSMLPYNSGY